MKRLFTVITVLILLTVNAYAGKGKVGVGSNISEAYIYVNGKKKAMTGAGFTTLLLEEGEYSIKVEKITDDGEWLYTKTKKIFVGEDTSIKINFNNISKKPTNKRFKRIEKEKKKKIEKEKEEKKTRFEKMDTLNIIHDKKRDLMWQDNSAAETTRKTLEGAKKYCSDLSLDDYSDWRVPTYDELLTIVDYSRSNPAIIPVFKNVASHYYWSSSESVSRSSGAWFVGFHYGNTNNSNLSGKIYVRCVRGRQ